MWAKRYQFPIGQGCFHAGVIGLSDPNLEKIHYVYDCGSKKQSTLQNAIDFYKTQTSLINALFVSHFDIDHVSGLDRLLAAVKVKTVYIPYVDRSVLILDLVKAEMNGALSASLIEASIEPESWFGSRGVQRVVRIRGSGDSPPYGLPDSINDSPEQSTEDGQEPSDEQEARENLTIMESPSLRHRQRGVTGQRSELLEAAPGTRIMILSGSKELDWLLLPHVDPAPKGRRVAFKNTMRAAIGLRPRQRLTSSRLAEALRDREKRQALRECYDEIIAGDHNRISMSLYSGPIEPEQTWRYWGHNYPFFCFPWELELSPLGENKTDAVGWLGTGDAALRIKKVRERWQNTYQSLGHQISTLLLPHHGSHLNFHEELLKFPKLKLCVASASNPSQYSHPSGEVVSTIWGHGKKFRHVSQHIDSGVMEMMSPVRNTDCPPSVETSY